MLFKYKACNTAEEIKVCQVIQAAAELIVTDDHQESCQSYTQ